MFAVRMVMKKCRVRGTESNLSNRSPFSSVVATRYPVLTFLAVSLLLISGITPVFAQDQSQAPPQDTTQSGTQNSGKPKQEVPAEAGGPTENVGPYSIPKKNPVEAPPPTPPPVSPNKVEGMPDYSIKVNVPLV